MGFGARVSWAFFLTAEYLDQHLYEQFRLVQAHPAWPKRAVGEGVMSCPRAGCREIRMSGSMSRG
jgi:hypothetical protein